MSAARKFRNNVKINNMADITELKEYLSKNWFVSVEHAEEAKNIAYEHFGCKIELNFQYAWKSKHEHIITVDDFKCFLFKEKSL